MVLDVMNDSVLQIFSCVARGERNEVKKGPLFFKQSVLILFLTYSSYHLSLFRNVIFYHSSSLKHFALGAA